MKSHTVPLLVRQDLLEEIRTAAKTTGLSQADVMRESMKAGIPSVVQRHSAAGRVTNVEPLPAEVLKRIYSQRDDDEPGIEALMAAQPIHTQE